MAYASNKKITELTQQNINETDEIVFASSDGTAKKTSVSQLKSAMNVQDKSEKGQPNGYASLDSSGKVPNSQLPPATAGSATKITTNDTTPDYLDAKLQVGAGLTKTINNAGGNEDLQIDAQTTQPIWNADKIKNVEVDDSNKADGKILKYNASVNKLEYQDGADTDEKVKATASDPTAGYLSDKVDNATIEVVSDKLKVKDNVFADKTHTHTSSEITDFDIAVSNNTDVSANTAKRHDPVTTTDTDDINFTLTGQDIQANIPATFVSSKTSNTSLTGTEEVLINNAGALEKTTVQDIADLGGGGGGAWETLATLTDNTGTKTEVNIDLSSIDTSQYLNIVVIGKINSVIENSTYPALAIRINNKTGSVYNWKYNYDNTFSSGSSHSYVYSGRMEQYFRQAQFNLIFSTIEYQYMINTYGIVSSHTKYSYGYTPILSQYAGGVNATSGEQLNAIKLYFSDNRTINYDIKVLGLKK